MDNSRNRCFESNCEGHVYFAFRESSIASAHPKQEIAIACDFAGPPSLRGHTARFKAPADMLHDLAAQDRSTQVAPTATLYHSERNLHLRGGMRVRAVS